MTKKPRSHQIDPGKGKAVPEGAVEDEAADAREALGQDSAGEDAEQGGRATTPGEKADAEVEKRAGRARKARSKAEAEPAPKAAGGAGGKRRGAKADASEAELPDEGPVSPDEADDAEAELDEERAEDAEDEAAGDTEEEPPKRSARRRTAETTTSSSRGRRSRRRDAEEAVSVRAQAKYVRCAPRKARLVVEHIRGKSVDDARAILLATPRAASKDVLKLLDSCVANAENNHELSADELRVEKAYVDEGPTIKRYRPRALGRATRIRKRTSHMTIYLTNNEGG
jgi:large subunit ribosomal protein L22